MCVETSADVGLLRTDGKPQVAELVGDTETRKNGKQPRRPE